MFLIFASNSSPVRAPYTTSSADYIDRSDPQFVQFATLAAAEEFVSASFNNWAVTEDGAVVSAGGINR